jgi:hypothetical protein
MDKLSDDLKKEMSKCVKFFKKEFSPITYRFEYRNRNIIIHFWIISSNEHYFTMSWLEKDDSMQPCIFETIEQCFNFADNWINHIEKQEEAIKTRYIDKTPGYMGEDC